MRQIIGYEFLLDFGDRQEWTQLQGTGGAIGNGALHVQDSRKAREIARQLLVRVHREMSVERCVWLSNDAKHAEALSVKQAYPQAVLECRPLMSKGGK
jgi:hypothetical protein